MNIVNAYLRKGRVKKNPVKYVFKDGAISTEIFQVSNLNDYIPIGWGASWSQYYKNGRNIWERQSYGTVWTISNELLTTSYAYQTSGSEMKIPTNRLVGYKYLKAIVKIAQQAPVYGPNYNFVHVGAIEIVDSTNEKVELRTDDNKNLDWTEISVDISSLNHIDYITITGCDGVAQIREIWLEG